MVKTEGNVARTWEEQVKTLNLIQVRLAAIDSLARMAMMSADDYVGRKEEESKEELEAAVADLGGVFNVLQEQIGRTLELSNTLV